MAKKKKQYPKQREEIINLIGKAQQGDKKAEVKLISMGQQEPDTKKYIAELLADEERNKALRQINYREVGKRFPYKN